MTSSFLIDTLAGLLTPRATQDGLLRALDEVMTAFGAVTGTLHRADPSGAELHAVAIRGVPPDVQPKIARIPFGKGMAGLCAARKEAVTVCDLQTDTSGSARPGARATGVEGAIVVPILAPSDGRVLGTLGIGKAAAHEYTAGESELLARCASHFAHALGARA